MASKGQGISINVIIIAAIALIVLVILATLVIRAGNNVNRSANVCGSVTGSEVCRSVSEGCLGTEIPNSQKTCLGFDQKPDPEQICCIRT